MIEQRFMPLVARATNLAFNVSCTTAMTLSTCCKISIHAVYLYIYYFWCNTSSKKLFVLAFRIASAKKTKERFVSDSSLRSCTFINAATVVWSFSRSTFVASVSISTLRSSFVVSVSIFASRSSFGRVRSSFVASVLIYV
jgi:hypothetical protein